MTKDYDNMGPWSAKQEKIGKAFIKKIAHWQTAVYEKTNGRLWDKFLGVPCAILTTTGRKSGIERKTPLLYLEDAEFFKVVVA